MYKALPITIHKEVTDLYNKTNGSLTEREIAKILGISTTTVNKTITNYLKSKVNNEGTIKTSNR